MEILLRLEDERHIYICTYVLISTLQSFALYLCFIIKMTPLKADGEQCQKLLIILRRSRLMIMLNLRNLKSILF